MWSWLAKRSGELSVLLRCQISGFRSPRSERELMCSVPGGPTCGHITWTAAITDTVLSVRSSGTKMSAAAYLFLLGPIGRPGRGTIAMPTRESAVAVSLGCRARAVDTRRTRFTWPRPTPPACLWRCSPLEALSTIWKDANGRRGPGSATRMVQRCWEHCAGGAPRLLLSRVELGRPRSPAPAAPVF
jgi:hypothetical protein